MVVDCGSYEFELRKEALRLCREDGFAIQAALWTALNNKEHRLQHFVQFTSIANSVQSSQKYEALEKRLHDLERTCGRSRSPRAPHKRTEAKAIPALAQSLALLSPYNGEETKTKGWPWQRQIV